MDKKSNLSIKSALIAKLMGLSAAIGLPVGAGAYFIRDSMTPEPRVPTPSTFSSLPLIPSAGPVRGKKLKKEKSAGVLDALRAYRARLNVHLGDAAPLIAGSAGALGAGAGYGMAQSHIANNRAEDINKTLAEKEKEFSDLLLREQLLASGVKTAEALDAMLDAAFVGYVEKSASGTANPMLDLIAAAMAMSGAAYGASSGWKHGIEGDRNRAIASALQRSIDERLMGNPEGPRAPMIVKMKTDRVGTSPVAGVGRGRSTGRDALSRL